MQPCHGAIVIGASAGALQALSAILPKLPRTCMRAVLIVVHLPPDRASTLAELLAHRCQLPVHEAEDKEPIMSGVVYVAPPDYHLLVERDKYISLSSEEPVHFSRPSIDLMFNTAAEAFGTELIGVILTGANDDGAEGLHAIELAGGMALVQRPESATAADMPRAALKACTRAKALSLEEIAELLCSSAT